MFMHNFKNNKKTLSFVYRKLKKKLIPEKLNSGMRLYLIL